jgi:aspartate/methionine/tyrosine aminotransferase
VKLEPFKLERFFAKHEFSVQHLACASDPDSHTVDEVLALEPGAREAWLRLPLGYTEPLGHPALRAAIAALTPGLGADHVLVHTGAEEAIFALLNVLLAPGDHAIVQAPCYQSLTEVAAGAGAAVSRWEVHEADRWQPDVDALASLVRPETKVLVINSPHNPTGALLDDARLEAIVAFARRHGLWLVGDEVYRGLEFAAPRSRSVVERYERAVSIGATAKAYGLAGLRIGWLTTRAPELLARVSAFKDYLSICSPGPSEYLAAIALRHAEVFAAQARATVVQNVAAMQRVIDASAGELSWVPPVAGTTGFVRRTKGDVSAWCDALLARTGVLFLPGPLFDFADTHFRVGLGRRALPAALKAAFAD